MPSAKKTRNITIRLDEKTVRRAKLVAARRGISVSRLLAEQLREITAHDSAYEPARRLALAALERGYHLGGKGSVSGEELHDRKDLR